MKHYTTTFFCDKGKYPKVHQVKFLEPPPDGRSPWPVSFTINSKDYEDGRIIFHLADESDFIAFKNSVIECYEDYRRSNYGR